MLWAALFFPQLHIDMLAAGRDMLAADRDMLAASRDTLPADQSAQQPLAVVVQESMRRLVMSSNSIARDMGIHPGMALNGAYAIAPDLHVVEYNEQTQYQHLEHLSLWAMQYSSWVTPQMPDLVLVEIEASLKLFGGLEALITQLRTDIQTQGLLLQLGVAPTPKAACLFARTGGKTGVLTKERLAPVLGEIPIDYLPQDAFTLTGLRQSGIKHCDQLFQLPAAALTRRFGQPCTELIYKMLGKLPDVCPAFTIPDTFSRSLDLPLEAPSVNALQFPLHRLLGALGGFLKTADLGVRLLSITLRHHHTKPTHISVGFLEATANHKHLFKVILERLANITLQEPATAITVTTQELAPVTHDDRDLFQKSQSQQSSIRQILDNLAAKIGTDKLYTPMLGDDHRPEMTHPVKICNERLQNTRTQAENWPARPVWLLQQPERADQPLVIKSTAERIENGWWGSSDVRRDYYIAADLHGTHFWVFADRTAPDELYIHGVFA